jgi:periplasmic protein TonB
MALPPNGQYRVQGWTVSVLVHSLVLTVALGLMAQIKPVVPQDPFKWDVSLVEPQRTGETRQAEIKPTEEPAKPTLRPVAPASYQPKMVKREAQPREEPPIKEQQPEIQKTKQAIEPIPPVIEHETMTAEPTITATPMQQDVSQPTTTEARVIEPTSVAHDPDPPAPIPATTGTSDSDAKPAEPMVKESAPQVAMATPPAPQVKADYGWLAESLRRRLAEVKRYPSAARLNGWEGKVVVRAVIRADGHLSEVKVHRSSGHETLDNAAMEAIRLVCPLHLQQALSTPEVVVYVPIVYGLAG